jgi:exodeoxyribonuclease VII small subunit
MLAQPTTPPPSFEDVLHELESLVDTLEKGDLSLEESLAAFERGVGLTRTCQKALDEAEQKVRILTARSADAELEPFPGDA